MLIGGVINLAFIFAREYWILLLFTSLSGMANYISWSGLYVVVPESYTTDLRGTAVGWSNSCGKLGGLFGPLIGGMMLDIENGFYIAITTTCATTIVVSFLACMMKETKGISLK